MTSFLRSVVTTAALTITLTGPLASCEPPGEKPEFVEPDCINDCDEDGYTTETSDCDDFNASVYPGADEECDGIDSDCDGYDGDNTSDRVLGYLDEDGDGYGDAGSPTSEPCDGYVDDATDCNDGDADINPAAVEDACDGIDSDCGGEPEEAVTWYVDADEDGYGDAVGSVEECTAPSGYVATNTDCNDGNPVIYPGAPETDCADATDYNCDGSVGFADADEDGYAACEECDDASAAIKPDAQEVCDAADVDEDCDFVADQLDDSVDPSTQETYFLDVDGDGYGHDASLFCEGEEPAEYDRKGNDCDEADPSENPGTVETCDGFDQNCDGNIDEGARDAKMWFPDVDGDGVGNALGASVLACADPGGYSEYSGDCDDTDARCNSSDCSLCVADDTGETGTIDSGVDTGETGDSGSDTDTGLPVDTDDTDTDEGDTDTGETDVVIDSGDTDVDTGGGEDTATGDTDTGGDTAVPEDDADGDGFTETDGDCDDSDANTYPGAAWLDSTSDCMTDADIDGYGDSAAILGVTAGSDCNDANLYVNLGEVETDGTIEDDDCDGRGEVGNTYSLLFGGYFTFIDNGDGVEDENDNLIPWPDAVMDGVGGWEIWNVCTYEPYASYSTADLTVSNAPFATTIGHDTSGMNFLDTDVICDTREVCYVQRDIPMSIGSLYAVKFTADNLGTRLGSVTMHLGSAWLTGPSGTEFSAGNLYPATDEVFTGSVTATQAVDDLAICAGGWPDHGTGSFGQVWYGLAE